MARNKLRDPWPRARWSASGWVQENRRIGGEAVAFLSMRLGTSLLVWLLVGIALALPAGLYLLQVNLTEMTASWEGRPGLSIYFRHGSGDAALALSDALTARAEVALVVVTSSEQALADFRANTSLGDTLTLLDDNPLPASLRATLVPGAGVADLERLAEFARVAPGADEVVVEKTWLERITILSSVVRRLGMILAVLFGVGAVLVTSTSVRLAIEARLEELRVLKLVGATDRQLRRPFLYFGALYGVGGGLVAAMLISFGLLVIESPLENLLGSYDQTLEISGFGGAFLVTLLTTGGLLGIIGALLAVRQRLRHLRIL